MVKTAVWLSLATLLLCAKDGVEIGEEGLQKMCLQCHIEEQIPSSLIYRKYLMRYSTPERIERAMFHYLKQPLKSDSIMPLQFFFKFPMKEKMVMDDATLKKYIHLYREAFDVKKMLRLP